MDADRLTIKAVKGRRVRDPITGQVLGSRARTVEATPFWRRRLADGDVAQAGRGRAAPKSENQQGSDS